MEVFWLVSQHAQCKEQMPLNQAGHRLVFSLEIKCTSIGDEFENTFYLLSWWFLFNVFFFFYPFFFFFSIKEIGQRSWTGLLWFGAGKRGDIFFFFLFPPFSDANEKRSFFSFSLQSVSLLQHAPLPGHCASTKIQAWYPITWNFSREAAIVRCGVGGGEAGVDLAGTQGSGHILLLSSSSLNQARKRLALDPPASQVRPHTHALKQCFTRWEILHMIVNAETECSLRVDKLKIVVEFLFLI